MRAIWTGAARWAAVAVLVGTGGLLLAAEPAAPAQGTGVENAPKTIADWWFSLTDVKTDRRIGGRHVVLRQQQDKDKSTLIVEEKLAKAQKDTSVGYGATVRYTLQPVLTPVSGEVTTNISGKRYLKGSFKLDGRQLTSTSSLTDADGTVIQAEHTEKAELPEGELVLVSQGLEVLAPALLPAAGRRDRIVLIEFPAELDTLLTVDGGFSLVRTDLADGSARFRLNQGTAEEPVWQYVLNGRKAIVDGTFYETRFVPSTQQEATRPVTGS